MTAMLDFKEVELYYDHVYALKGVSLSVNQGETVALIGANGAGKSSILRTITGLATPKTGSVTFEGSRVDGTDPSSIVRRGIAMVPEGRRVFPFMSVKDNLMMGAFTREDKADIQNTLESILTRFPRLKERYNQAAGTLSGGEQQMMSVLLVEQNSRMALSISHRAYAMATGNIVIEGNSKELLHDDRIKAAYLGGEV